MCVCVYIFEHVGTSLKSDTQLNQQRLSSKSAQSKNVLRFYPVCFSHSSNAMNTFQRVEYLSLVLP